MKKYKLTTGQQVLILIILALGLNINTLFNEYALDDAVVLTGNSLVQKGIKGIPEILKTEFFFGLEKKESDLSGGRYRPVALVIFAIEYELFGANPFVSHLINVLLFALLIAYLFILLKKHIFRDQHEYLAFFTCLIFVFHPIHTEVIANIKSRDELIVSLLLIASSFTFIRYSKNKSTPVLVLGFLCFFLALLTRESAVPFIAIVPLVAYFFFGQSLKQSVIYAIPLVLIFVGYMALRIAIVGFHYDTVTDVLNAPFYYATKTEAFATKVFLLVKYLGLLFFPHPLSFDYGFNQIPYLSLGSVKFILSFTLLTGMVIYALVTFRKRSMASFCILFFFISIFLFSNFIIDIGAPLAERLLFQPSLAFCLAISLIYLKISEKSAIPATAILVILLSLGAIKTITRNADWKNNDTLFLNDVETVPNSVRANLYAARQYIQKAKSEPTQEKKNIQFRKALYYDERILEIYPHYRFIYDDLGMAYFGLLDYFKAADYWEKAQILDPTNATAQKRNETLGDILYNEGNRQFRNGNLDSAIIFYRKSVDINDKNVDAWYNLGGCYFLKNDTKNGIEAWQEVNALSPNHPLDRDQFQIPVKK